LKIRVRILKTCVWLVGLTPLGVGLFRLFLGDGFGVNPIEGIEHYTGDVAVSSLLVVLAVTPIRRLTGWNDLQKARRLVGLFAFFYVTLHFLVWLGLDQFFAWGFIGEDIAERPFILVGFTAFVLLIPLALTSTKGWIRRLGKRWTQLHQLVYVASALGIVHFYWATKADDRWPARAILVWLVLMAARVPWRERWAAVRARVGRAPEGERGAESVAARAAASSASYLKS
jgi:sulfoxide reductase heme-binding subunit YedZ